MNTANPKSTHDSIASLTSASIGNNSMIGLPAMLETLAGEANTFGCVIWAAPPPPNASNGQPGGHLVALGQWFPVGGLCRSTPPLASTIGATIRSRKTFHVEAVAPESGLCMDAEYFKSAGIKSVLSVPVSCGDAGCWAVSFFHTQSAPLADKEVARIESLVSVVPALYQAIRSSARVGLLRRIEKITGRAEIRRVSPVPLNHRVRRDILLLCREIAGTFNCSETSIFLRDSLDGPTVPRLAATMWQRREGLSEPDGGMDPQPPGVATVPIAAGREVLGHILCRALTTDGLHSAESDLDLLQSVAARVGYYWINWLRRCAAHGERLAWRSLVRGLDELDKFALNVSANEEEGAERLICGKALLLAATVVSAADMLDVRTVDEEAQEFRLLVTHGSAWSKGTAAEVSARKKAIPFPAAASPSAGGQDLPAGSVSLTRGDSVERFYSEAFPGIRQMISTPIFVNGKLYARLSMCAVGETAFPEYAPTAAEMICQRLGSYKHLAETTSRLRQTGTRLDSMVQIHSQFHEDLAHQLKSPIFQAHLRVQKALRHKELDDKLKLQLQAVRGLCGKASKVTMSTKLFAALARGEKFQPNLSPLWYDDLIKMLIEAATDSELVANPSRHVRFRVNREMMLESLPTNNVLAHVDNDLLQQAIANLLDNAGKYSYANTVVRISASSDNSRRFFISVINEGLPISAEDVSQCIQRHWRGEKASQTTGEGSGIGLWIVHHIMEAHGGKLQIIPTTPGRLTEVRLVFH